VHTSTHVKTGSRSSSALRLLALIFTTFVLNVAAFAQAAPLLTLSSTVSLFDFGRRNTGTISAITTIRVLNSGTASLTISNVTLTGVNPGDYQLTASTCIGATLSPNASCTASVRFAPVGVGVRTARLTFADNAAGSQHLVPLTGVGLNPAIPNRAVGPIDPRHGFPLWYQDDMGLKLALCLNPANGLCLETPPNPNLPASVTDALVNFPGEAFWWTTEAEINLPGGGRARLVLAKEAAFTTEEATVGEQISFDRVRVRLDEVAPNTTYTFTHPFGTVTAVSDEDGEVDETQDIGCGASPCNFAAALNGKISIFLKWDPAIAPAAPAGYLGDPNVPHRIVGSPLNTNFFRVAGPNIGGAGVNSVQTNLFNVSGKIY
jgi:hypothetical protein